jgi:hypothetical protein
LPSGEKKPIEGISREELDYRYPNWENWTAGEPSLFWFDGTNAKINLVCKPSAAYALTNALKVWEIRVPANMTAAADIPFDSNTPMIPVPPGHRPLDRGAMLAGRRHARSLGQIPLPPLGRARAAGGV